MNTILVWVLSGVLYGSTAHPLPTYPSVDLAGCERQKTALARAAVYTDAAQNLQCVQVAIPTERPLK